MSKVQETQQLTIVGRDDEEQTFNGRLLGSGSSQRPGRTHWFEVAIYKDDDTQEYVVHTRGVSTIPGQITYSRIVRTIHPFKVELLLTVQQNGVSRIPRASLEALAECATYDEPLRDVYINRAV